jgi:sarcosine oxidase
MHVVVVGAGVFGTWTAHHLIEAGAQVTLVDGYGPANSRSSSGDETRIVRCGYGEDAIYSEMARDSLLQWQALDERAPGRERLWHPCGVLWMAAGNDPYTDATRQTLERGRFTCEVLDRAALSRRYPEIDPGDLEVALLEPGCGIVMSRRAVQTLARELGDRGVHLVRARIQPPAARFVDAVDTEDGSRIAADRIVFATGAWLPTVFPHLLAGRIRPTRQVVVYFGTASGDGRFQAGRWPAWIDFPSGIYGTPDVEGRGVKVGIDAHGPSIDPDRAERLADPLSIATARAWLARRIPALADAPVVEARVCQYENTATGDFLIDRHPDHANVWIVGGGSGHGFKHGPAVGAVAARAILDGEMPDRRFALEGKTADVRRAVY